MWWRVYFGINPLWLSCSNYSVASLLGLAPNVAQTKYQSKMLMSSVPQPYPQNTWRFPVWLLACTFLIEFNRSSCFLTICGVPFCLGKTETLPVPTFCDCTIWDLVDIPDCQGSLCHISAVAAHWWCHKPVPAPLHHGWHFHGWRDLEWAKHLTSRKGFHYCSRNSHTHTHRQPLIHKR